MVDGVSKVVGQKGVPTADSYSSPKDQSVGPIAGSQYPDGNDEAVARVEREICREIKTVEADLRQRHPWLRYQDALGGLVMVLSVLGVAAGYWLHLSDESHTGKCIGAVLIVVFFTSILHEMEHDLIHSLYFSRYPITRSLCFMIVWISKLHANPWWRKTMHLKHHIFSGLACDAEERLIGLGLPFGIMRMIVAVHPLGSVLLSHDVAKESTYLDVDLMVNMSVPAVAINIIMNKLLLAYVLAMYFYGDDYSSHWPFLPTWLYWWVAKFHLLSFLPNCIRQTGLVLASTLSHYYGDIPSKSVFYQNQILDHWALVPMQLSCFNFGATHIVHHYVPSQPFYLRQMVYSSGVREFMIKQGVRHNDLSILTRANRFYEGRSRPSDNAEATNFLAFFLLCFTTGVVFAPLYDFVVVGKLLVMAAKAAVPKHRDAMALAIKND